MRCQQTVKCFRDMYTQGKAACQQAAACFASCDNRKTIVCVEKGKRYELDNSVTKFKAMSVHIDGGVVVKDPGNKCDYLLYFIKNDGSKCAVLLELKGKNYAHALLQLADSVEMLKAFLSSCNRTHLRVVFRSKKTPRIEPSSSDGVAASKILKQKVKGLDYTFARANLQMTEQATDL